MRGCAGRDPRTRDICREIAIQNKPAADKRINILFDKFGCNASADLSRRPDISSVARITIEGYYIAIKSRPIMAWKSS